MQILSNMSSSMLVIHGVRFHSAEQVYQAAKATYAGNRYLMNCIMNAHSLFECKRLGQTICWEISVEWRNNFTDGAVLTMIMILRHKYHQCP